MKRGEKILFIIAILLAIVALVFGSFSTYFGISAQIAMVEHEENPNLGTSLGVGFLLVFMVIAFVISAGATLLSTIFFVVRPVRSQVLRVRRVSRTTVAVMVVMLTVQAVFFLLGIL